MLEKDSTVAEPHQFDQLKIQQTLKYGIADFSKRIPKRKHRDQAVFLCFLEELIRAGLAKGSKCAVGLSTDHHQYCIMHEETMAWIYEAPGAQRPKYHLPRWNSTPITTRLAAWHTLLILSNLGTFKNFTLRFHEDTVKKAFASSQGPCSYMHERLQHHLGLIGIRHFWQAFERTNDGVVHSHGALWAEKVLDDAVISRALRVAGGEMESHRRARQVQFSDPIPGHHLGWVMYARKDPDLARGIFRGDAYSCSTRLRSAGRALYESARRMLNATR